MEPKISVTICTYNRANFLLKAIESVLAQTFTDYEIIIVDDASTDNTETLVEPYLASHKNILYVKNPVNLGISKTRNIALSHAHGEYIAVLDSDDTWTDTNKLQKQFDFLEQNKDYVLIGSNIQIVDEHGVKIQDTTFPTEDTLIRATILKSNPIPHSTVLYRKTLAEKVGRYSEKLSCVEDLDLFLRLGLLGKVKNLAEITTAYTRHSGGTSHTRKITMAWNHYTIVLKNIGKYPHWLSAITWAKLRLLKNLF